MEIPNEIINRIMLYNSHPLADLFKESVKLHLETQTKMPPESCMSDMTFANYLSIIKKLLLKRHLKYIIMISRVKFIYRFNIISFRLFRSKDKFIV